MPPRALKPKSQLLVELQKEFGVGAEFYKIIADIARGKGVLVPTDMEGVFRRVIPTTGEILMAAIHMLDRINGKVRQGVDVTVDNATPKKNYDALSVAELEQLEALTRKITDGEVVEGQFTLTEGNK